jgi:predicted DsbA family dithiol-disulfide isomerase
MRVDIWSDVACPWCYVGKRRFEEALAAFPHAGEVDVHWRSFELDPRAPRLGDGDRIGYLAAKYRVPREEAEARVQRVTDLANAVGIDLHYERVRGGNTFDAHRLIHLAAAHSRAGEAKERFLAAYFVDGEPIGEPAVLARLAREAGLPGDEVDDVLAGNRYAEAVRADEATARALGATAVPFFVIDETYGIAGAQTTEIFAGVLERAWSETHPEPAGSSEPAAVGPDGCVDGACPV